MLVDATTGSPMFQDPATPGAASIEAASADTAAGQVNYDDAAAADALGDDVNLGSILYGSEISPSTQPEAEVPPASSEVPTTAQPTQQQPQGPGQDQLLWGIRARDTYIGQLENYVEQFRPLEIALTNDPGLKDSIYKALTGQAPAPAPTEGQTPPATQPTQQPGLPPAYVAQMQNEMYKLQVGQHEIQAQRKLDEMSAQARAAGIQFDPNAILQFSLATGELDLDKAWGMMQQTARIVGSMYYPQQSQQQQPQGNPQGWAPQVVPQQAPVAQRVPAAVPRVQPPGARMVAPAAPIPRAKDWSEAAEQAIRMLGTR